MTSPYYPQRQVPDQAARRVDLKLKDQHGRLHHIIFDQMPRAGVIQIIPLYKAPWLADLKYCHAEGGAIPTGVRWDYSAALSDNRVAWDRWFGEFRMLAGRMPGVDAMASYTAATKGEWKLVPPALLAEVGITPEPEDYIKAAMANNSWVLGLTTAVPKWAEPLLSLRDARRRAEVTGEASDLDRYRDAVDEFEEEEPAGMEKFTPKKKG